jgi:very-short-patch-repair endonuclease/predicted transcriptional regulator of viral defense system
MAAADRANRPKATLAIPSSGDKHRSDAFLPGLVPLKVVSGFAHAVGREIAIAWVAARQLGLITVGQLNAAGVGRGSIARRAANVQLHQVFRGVYLVGHPVPLAGALELAGVLACGEGAVVSHHSAARLWGLTKTSPGEVEVTIVGRDCRSRKGLRVHTVKRLGARDRGRRSGIPITSAARTVIDVCATAVYEEAERVIAEASALKLTGEQQILAAADRAPNRAGVARIRAVLGQPGGPRRTRSDGERALLRLIRAARLPVPATDVPLLGFTADFLWPEHRLIVELDGYPAHGHRAAFERDHRRDVVHRDAGYEVLRFTGRQLEQEPFYVLAVIARALDRRNGARG